MIPPSYSRFSRVKEIKVQLIELYAMAVQTWELLTASPLSQTGSVVVLIHVWMVINQTRAADCQTPSLSLLAVLEAGAPTDAPPASSILTNQALHFQTQLGAVLLLPPDGHYGPAPGEIVFMDDILEQLFTFLLN